MLGFEEQLAKTNKWALKVGKIETRLLKEERNILKKINRTIKKLRDFRILLVQLDQLKINLEKNNFHYTTTL